MKVCRCEFKHLSYVFRCLFLPFYQSLMSVILSFIYFFAIFCLKSNTYCSRSVLFFLLPRTCNIGCKLILFYFYLYVLGGKILIRRRFLFYPIIILKCCSIPDYIKKISLLCYYFANNLYLSILCI